MTVQGATQSDFSLAHTSGKFMAGRGCNFKARLPLEWQNYSIVCIESGNFESRGDKERIELMLCVHCLFKDSSYKLNEKRRDAIDEQGQKTFFDFRSIINRDKTEVKITIWQKRDQNKTYIIQEILRFSPSIWDISRIRLSILLKARQGEQKILETAAVELPLRAPQEKVKLTNQLLPIHYKATDKEFSIVNRSGRFATNGESIFSIHFPLSWQKRSVILIDETTFEKAKSDPSVIYLMLRVHAVKNATQEEASRDAIVKINEVFDSYFEFTGRTGPCNTWMELRVQQKKRDKTYIVSDLFKNDILISVVRTTLLLTLQAREGGETIDEKNKMEFPPRIIQKKKKRLKKQKQSELEKRQKITN